MAEAAAGARLDAALVSVRDVMFLSSEDGTYSLILSFNPWRLRKQIVRSLFSMKLALENTVWPISPGIWGSVCSLTALQVFRSPRESWWRSGWIASALWSYDSLFPWQNYLPINARLLWLSLMAGSLGAVGLSIIQRTLLKLLLQYQGYMHLEHNTKPSFLMKMWFVFVKALSGPKPGLYNFQGVLPSLPVPPVKQTCTKFLESVKPLLSDEEFREMEEKATRFLKRDAWKLQMFLYVRKWFTSNWLWTWWEKYVYLTGRDPIMINSNYYILDSRWFHACDNQARRSAMLLYQAHKFKRMVDWQQLDPIMLQKVVPLCMKQYERIFDTTRIPGLECDQIIHYADDPQRYVAVNSRGVWYKLHMTIRGSKGIRPCNVNELEQQIQWILDDSAANPARPGEDSIAALTGWNRTRWAEARNRFFWEGVNKSSLSIIEQAMTVLYLDHRTPKDIQEQARMLMHGDGKSLWFDKSVSFITFPNGKGGIMAEHSYADALAVAHMWEWVISGEWMALASKDKDAMGIIEEPGKEVDLSLQRPLKLAWNLSQQAKDVIQIAVEDNAKLIDDLDLQLVEFTDFGKGFIKKAGVSPDAFVQLAMQLAYKRDSGGKRALTYEASVTRLFNKGRTETVRSLSVESAAFVDAMLDESSTPEERVALLRKAADKHTKLYKNAMMGQGIDRHLLGLYVSSKYIQGLVNILFPSYVQQDDFLKSALSLPWTLSTSQTPLRQTEGRWNPDKDPEDAKKLTVGGGFGPVAEHGYGVSYPLGGENTIFFHISSKKHSPATDSQRFADNIRRALWDMRKAVEALPKPASRKAK